VALDAAATSKDGRLQREREADMAADGTGSGRTVDATINYFGDAPEKPTFHAQDHRRDNWRQDVRKVTFHDARSWTTPPSLTREGIMLAPHKTSIRDFADRDEVRRTYPRELEELIASVTGAKRVVGFQAAHMRFSPRSNRYMTGSNSQPASFPHVDVTPKTSHGLVPSRVFNIPAEELAPGEILVGFNIWRVVSEPPQDMPLAVCDVRTVAREDLVEADGVYDEGPEPWMRSEAYIVRHNPAHRWIYFSDMRPDEALIFRSYGNEKVWIAGAPHSAFHDPTCPPDAGPRISVEARAYGVFDG
jgi:hypothetical protein